MSKVCGNCRYFVTTGCSSVCTLYCSGTSYGKWCRNHEGARVFDSISASPEKMADKLVYQFIGYDSNGLFHGYWKSTITEESYSNKTEAIAATVERLKETYHE